MSLKQVGYMQSLWCAVFLWWGREKIQGWREVKGQGSCGWLMEGEVGMDAAFPSCFAALPLLLFALELPQTSRPNVPPLDHQAVLIRHQAQTLCPWTRGSTSGSNPWPCPWACSTVTAAHHQESFAHLDLGTFAGQVLHVYPQDVVASLQRLATALVHRHNTNWEFGPVPHRLHVQHVHLDCWERIHKKYSQVNTANTVGLFIVVNHLFYFLTIILLAIFLHVDLQVALNWFTIGLTVCEKIMEN